MTLTNFKTTIMNKNLFFQCDNIDPRQPRRSTISPSLRMVSALIAILLTTSNLAHGQVTVGLLEFTTIQAALNFVEQQNLNDAIIMVAPGEYCENLQMPTTVNVTLRSTTPDNPAATQINGKDIGTTITISSDVMFLKHTIDGFQITGGSDSGIVALNGTQLCLNNSDVNSNFVEENSVEGGGGIRAVGAVVNINNSTIQDNAAVIGGGVRATEGAEINFDGNSSLSENAALFDGGGFQVEEGGAVNFEPGAVIDGNFAATGEGGGGLIAENGQANVDGAQINNNEAANFGGIAVQVQNSVGDVNIINATFSNNQGRSGGAVAVVQNSSSKPFTAPPAAQRDPTRNNPIGSQTDTVLNGVSMPLIMGCTFQGNGNNVPDVGGAGAILLSAADAMIIDCNFIGNTASVDGGAIQCVDCGSMIMGCNFEMNRSDAFTFQGGGGAIQVDNSSPMIFDCSFLGNSCPINDGGAIFNVNGSNTTIENCSFIGNFCRIDGGAINSEASSATIVGCNFEMNMTTNSAFNAGGAIMDEGGQTTVENCQFIANESREGGAIFCFEFEPTLETSQLTVVDCTFIDNTSEFTGGAIRIEENTTCSVSNSHFANNEGCSGAAISCANSTIEVSNCEMISNLADGFDGGAMNTFNCLATISNCLFEDNSAGDDAGAFFLDDTQLLMTFCRFIGNQSQDLGGAMVGFSGSDATLVGCEFIGNSCGSDGGAVLYNAANVEYLSCLFSGNVAGDDGGALVCSNLPSQTINNCTFANNSAVNLGQAIICNNGNSTDFSNSILWDNGAEPVHVTESSAASFDFCNIQGGVAGSSNMDIDPQFENALGNDGLAGTSDDDLRLLPGSPMIDAGNNDAVLADAFDLDQDGDAAEPVPFDLRMMVRFADNPDVPDAGNGVAPVVDLGAIEFSDILLGDINLDGTINLLDVAPFVTLLSGGSFQAEADVNQDGVVNLLDIEPFVEILSS